MTNPVWIIDDDRSIRWVFEKALAREGIAHKTFVAAQDALDSLPDDPPQVVVSDIRMPGVSGLEFMQQLKARLPSTPVISTVACDCESRPIERNTSCIAGAWPRISGAVSPGSAVVSWRMLSSTARLISSTA